MRRLTYSDMAAVINGVACRSMAASRPRNEVCYARLQRAGECTGSMTPAENSIKHGSQGLKPSAFRVTPAISKDRY